MRRGFCVLHHTDKPYSAGLRIGTLERPTNPDLPAPLGSADKRSGQLSAHASTGSCPCHILAQAASKTAASLAAPFGKQEQQVHDIAATAETKGFVGERPDKTQVRKTSTPAMTHQSSALTSFVSRGYQPCFCCVYMRALFGTTHRFIEAVPMLRSGSGLANGNAKR